MKRQFVKEVETNLRDNILTYWSDKMVDPRGGFYGRRDGSDRLDEEAPKGAILNARILWAFSAAYRVLGDKKYLNMATRAKDEIIGRFYDREFGGVYWSLNADSTPFETKKQFYALGFAIYGLSEYHRATGDPESLEYAVKLYHDIEAHSHDRKRGGYIEALTRDWQPIEDMRLSDKDDNASKTMNTHLHIIEPYTNLLRVWPEAGLLKATKSLLEIFLDRIGNPEYRGHMGLFYDNDWQRLDSEISYGHDIEASWLLLETAQVINGVENNPELLKRTLESTHRMADAALEGRCADGSMVYERHGNGRYDNDKHWWVQAEAVVGQLWQYSFHNRPEMLPAAFETWGYIRDNLVDPAGEWYWSRKNGEVNRKDDKAGFWKCPYHNTRMALEVIERLR